MIKVCFRAKSIAAAIARTLDQSVLAGKKYGRSLALLMWAVRIAVGSSQYRMVSQWEWIVPDCKRAAGKC
jgi:hypothetical protein